MGKFKCERCGAIAEARCNPKKCVKCGESDTMSKQESCGCKCSSAISGGK